MLITLKFYMMAKDKDNFVVNTILLEIIRIFSKEKYRYLIDDLPKTNNNCSIRSVIDRKKFVTQNRYMYYKKPNVCKLENKTTLFKAKQRFE